LRQVALGTLTGVAGSACSKSPVDVANRKLSLGELGHGGIPNPGSPLFRAQNGQVEGFDGLSRRVSIAELALRHGDGLERPDPPLPEVLSINARLRQQSEPFQPAAALPARLGDPDARLAAGPCLEPTRCLLRAIEAAKCTSLIGGRDLRPGQRHVCVHLVLRVGQIVGNLRCLLERLDERRALRPIGPRCRFRLPLRPG
jgi:hypothetical protein